MWPLVPGSIRNKIPDSLNGTFRFPGFTGLASSSTIDIINGNSKIFNEVVSNAGFQNGIAW